MSLKPLKWSASKAFLKGEHQDVVERVRAPKTSADKLALIGSMAFLGRFEEASALWKSSADMTEDHKVRARFALALAATRISKFRLAHKFLIENWRNHRQRPDTYQGIGIYYYYMGRFELSLKFARKALQLSIAQGDRYMHAFATDLCGHVLIQTGRRLAGIQMLKEAHKVANPRDANDWNTVERVIYEAEAGLRSDVIVKELEGLLANSPQNSYSQANLTLELARQLTRRGQWLRAKQVLDEIAPTIYGFENRRQELKLQIRLAEIAYQRGDSYGSAHFLQAARHCLNQVADRSYEIEILRLEHKIERKLRNREPSPQSLASLEALETHFGRTRIISGQDPYSELIELFSTQPEEAKSQILKIGYLGLWHELSGLEPGEEVFYLNADGTWLAVSREGVHRSEVPLTSLSIRILAQMASGQTAKEELIQNVWGYQYDPLRHDSLVYSALNNLRKSLGPVANWLETHDQGWTFRNFSSASERPKSDPIPFRNFALPTNLNWRQTQAVRAESREWTVPLYKKRFKVSTMTAWRDLDVLCKAGYVQSIGKGRATVYVRKE